MTRKRFSIDDLIAVFIVGFLVGFACSFLLTPLFAPPPPKPDSDSLGTGFIESNRTSDGLTYFLRKGRQSRLAPVFENKSAAVALERPSQGEAATNSVNLARRFIVTAYCGGRCCCDKWSDGITASGHKIQKGDRFVAAPPEIPFETMVKIPDYGIVPVLDRGSAIKSNRFDVFFDDKDGISGHQRALNWGRQQLKVEILK